MGRNSNGPELTFLFAADIARFEAGINRIIAQLGKVEASINRASASFNRLGTSSGVAANDVNRLIVSLNSNKRSLDANTEAARKNIDAMGKLQSSFEKGRGAADQSGKSIEGVIGNLKGMLGAYVGVDAVMRGGRAFVENAVEVGRFQKVLETASGSQSAYAHNMQFLESVSDEFRLNVIGLGKEFANLSVATRGTSLEGKETEKIFRSVAMAASAMQMSGSQVTLTFKAFTDMISKGVVSSEELKRQLGNHMPGAFQLAAKAMGVTTAQLQKMLDNGDMLATDLLPKLATEIEKTFGDGAQSGAKSLGNNIEYAKGQLSLFFAEFAKSSGANDGLNSIAVGIGDLAKQARSAIGGPVGDLLRMLGAMAGFALNASTGFAIGGLPEAGSVYNGYVNSLNPFQQAAARDKEKRFKESNASYAAEADKKAARDKFKAQVDAERMAQSNSEYSKMAGERLKAFAGADKAERSNYLNQYKAEAEEFAKKIAEIDAQAQRNAIAEWKDKESRTGFDTTLGEVHVNKSNIYGKNETYKGTKELATPTGFDQITKILSDKIKNRVIPVPYSISLEVENENAAIAETSLRLEQLRDRLSRLLIDNYGSLDAAAKAGWGKIINSTKEGVEGVSEVTKGLSDITNGIEFANQLENILQNGASSLGSAVFEYIGEAASGLNGIESLQERIGSVFGDLLLSLGKAALAYAAAKAKILASLTSVNPAVAAAAGALAIVMGATLKANVKKKSEEATQRFWTGGIVDGPTGGVDRVPALLRPGELVMNERMQHTFLRMLRQGPGQLGTRGGVNNLSVEVNVTGRIRGMDMLFLQEKASRARSRSGGRK